jgi:hypothetical protein
VLTDEWATPQQKSEIMQICDTQRAASVREYFPVRIWHLIEADGGGCSR